MMDLTYTETQKAVEDVARRFLAKTVTAEYRRAVATSEAGYDADSWASVINQGWLEIVSDLEGGWGYAGRVLAQMGRHCFPSPYLQCLTVASVAARTGSNAGRAAILGDIAKGTIHALVAPVDLGRLPTARVGTDGLVRLSGGPFIVEWALQAERLVCAARSADGAKFYGVEPGAPGLSILPQPSMDHVRVASVELVDTPIAVEISRDLSLDVLMSELSIAALLRAAEILGTESELLDMTIAYVQAREQFGRAIGSFQVTQHTLADRKIRHDGASMAVEEGLKRVDRGEHHEAGARIAAYFAAKTGQEMAVVASQLHGGIGFMSEYHLHHYYRHALAEQLRLGAIQMQRERIAALVVDAVAAHPNAPVSPVTGLAASVGDKL